ncbi:MAG: hypothetical protein R6U91_08010 [Bacillota bacterium]
MFFETAHGCGKYINRKVLSAARPGHFTIIFSIKAKVVVIHVSGLELEFSGQGYSGRTDFVTAYFFKSGGKIGLFTGSNNAVGGDFRFISVAVT